MYLMFLKELAFTTPFHKEFLTSDEPSLGGLIKCQRSKGGRGVDSLIVAKRQDQGN